MENIVAIKMDRAASMARFKHNKKVYETGIGEYMKPPSIPEEQKISLDEFITPAFIRATAKFYHDTEEGNTSDT